LLSELEDSMMKNLTLVLPVSDISKQMVSSLTEFSRRHKGNTRLKISLLDQLENSTVEMLSRKIKVEPIGFLKELLKQYQVKFRLN
jgi:DNA polymerase III subunit alpha